MPFNTRKLMRKILKIIVQSFNRTTIAVRRMRIIRIPVAKSSFKNIPILKKPGILT